MKEKYPSIAYLLGAYFHQDAGPIVENETKKLGLYFGADIVTANFRSFLQDEPITVKRNLVEDIDKFLVEFSTDETAKAAIASFEPDWSLQEVVNIRSMFRDVSNAIKNKDGNN